MTWLSYWQTVRLPTIQCNFCASNQSVAGGSQSNQVSDKSFVRSLVRPGTAFRYHLNISIINNVYAMRELCSVGEGVFKTVMTRERQEGGVVSISDFNIYISTLELPRQILI